MLKPRTFGVLLAAVLVVLVTSPARAQQQSDPGKKPQQPSAAPQEKNQGAAENKAEKPREDAKKADDSKKADESRKTDSKKADDSKKTEKPMADKDKGQAEKDRPNADRSRDTSREPSRNDRSTQPSTDRSRDTSRDSQRSTDRSRDSSRDSQRSTDRSRDTSRDSSRDTSRDSQRSSDRSTQKQFSASDLGFKFSENDSSKGLKITDINSNSVATKSEFKQGDTIVSVNDHTVRSQRDFIHFIQVAPRQRIAVVVLRDDREVTLYLQPDVIQEFVVTSGGAWLGVDLYDRFSRAAVILKVYPGSPAERAGLRADDLIVAVDREEIRSPEHLGQVIGGLQPGTSVEIEVERNRQSQFLDATLGQRENVTQRTEIRERSLLPRR